MTKTILVTGGAGDIGSHAFKALARGSCWMNVHVLPPDLAECRDYVWHAVSFAVDLAPDARLVVPTLRWSVSPRDADGGAV